MTEKLIDWKIMIAGIAALTAIEICALTNGVDGTLMTIIVGIIALAIGISIPNPFSKV